MIKFRWILLLVWLFTPLMVVTSIYLPQKRLSIMSYPASPNESLQGVDANSNELRDDVEVVLQRLKWPEPQYQVATEYALKLQQYMTLKSNSVAAVELASKAQACAAMQMHHAFPKGGTVDAYDAVMGVFNMVLNSELRQKAYMNNENILDEANNRASDKSDCGLA